jgi:hypothetical protein
MEYYMEEIKIMLEDWKNLPTDNKVFQKDYYIENEQVRLMIFISVEKAFLFKTFTAVCKIEKQAIEYAIERLDEKKDELI